MRWLLGVVVALAFGGCDHSGDYKTITANAADQFDLNCKGIYRDFRYNINKPVVTSFRIDLRHKFYCIEECSQVSQIEKFDERNIELEKPYNDDPVYGTKIEQIDRVTGKYTGANFPATGPGNIMETNCKPAAFSGFPHPTAKF